MMDDLTFAELCNVQQKKKSKFGWSRQFHSLTQCRIAPVVQSIMGRERREGTEKRLQCTDTGPGSHLWTKTIIFTLKVCVDQLRDTLHFAGPFRKQLIFSPLFVASRDNYRLSSSVLLQLTLGFIRPRCGKAATEGDLSGRSERLVGGAGCH